MLPVNAESQSRYTRSFIEYEIQKRIILQDMLCASELFDTIVGINCNALPIGDGETIDTSDHGYFYESPEHVLVGLGNEIGFDFDKLYDYFKENGGEIQEDEDDESFKASVIAKILEENDRPIFSNLLADNDEGDSEIDELIECFKEIEDQYINYLELTGLKWFDTPFAYHSSIDETEEAPYLTQHLKRYDMVFKKNAFEINGENFDIIAFFEPEENDYDYHILFHDGFKAFAMKDMQPVAKINGTIHYISGYFTFENPMYYNSKDAMSQFDADFAHYLINKCENGFTESGQVCDLLFNHDEHDQNAIIHFEGMESLSGDIDSYQVIGKLIESSIREMNQKTNSIIASCQDFDYKDPYSYINHDNIVFEPYRCGWNRVSYAFMDDLHAHIPNVQTCEYSSEESKEDTIKQLRDWGEHFDYAAENMQDKEIIEKFIIYLPTEPVSHMEDLLRLASHNDFYGMFEDKEKEDRLETIDQLRVTP